MALRANTRKRTAASSRVGTTFSIPASTMWVRGTVCDKLVEAIDLVPTFMEAHGMAPAYHRLEGRSLLPILRGEDAGEWRDFVFSELDYSFYRARLTLERKPAECRIYMVRDARWKYIQPLLKTEWVRALAR